VTTKATSSTGMNSINRCEIAIRVNMGNPHQKTEPQNGGKEANPTRNMHKI
jgi:hypothetical protein